MAVLHSSLEEIKRVYGTALVSDGVDGAARYLTIREAAACAGYRSASNLHAAVRKGRLKTTTLGPLRTRVTTQEWLDEFLAGLRFNTQFRGKPKGQDDDASGV